MISPAGIHSCGAFYVHGWTVRRGRMDAQERRLLMDGTLCWRLLRSRLSPGGSVQDTPRVRPCRLGVRHPCLPTVLDRPTGTKALRGGVWLVALFIRPASMPPDSPGRTPRGPRHSVGTRRLSEFSRCRAPAEFPKHCSSGHAPVSCVGSQSLSAVRCSDYPQRLQLLCFKISESDSLARPRSSSWA